MNVLFFSIAEFDSIYQREIYPDLLREFMHRGHEVYVVSSSEKRDGKSTQLLHEGHAHILKVKVGNITKSNLIEKGFATLRIESQFKNAIKKYYSKMKFDLIMYATPPITLVNLIKYIKKRDNAKTYLLLKDIFPQNAVDLGILKTSGLKSVIYYAFRRKEKRLYDLSDVIGCMSKANIEYLLEHNPEINDRKIEICPNCIEIIDKNISHEERQNIRNKYHLPLHKKIFVYGGNLGKPQGIDFLIECLKSQKERKNLFFLIIGDGTEYEKLEAAMKGIPNARLMKKLPKDDYDTMISACDVGMIFLDHRFTIPNFPSRLLAYMQAGLPVLACTDPNTDIGKVIMRGGFGWWCESNDVTRFSEMITDIISADIVDFGKNGREYLENYYTVTKAYQIIVNSL